MIGDPTFAPATIAPADDISDNKVRVRVMIGFWYGVGWGLRLGLGLGLGGGFVISFPILFRGLGISLKVRSNGT